MQKVTGYAFLFLLFFFMATLAKAQAENAILGLWYNTEKTALVEILKKGSTFIGKNCVVERPKSWR